MKLTVSIIICMFLVIGCNEDKKNDNVKVSKMMMLLKVDYTTNTFLGGTQIELAPYENVNDSIPLQVNYIEPADFGSLSVYYQPTNGLLFNGSIILDSLGQVSYPTSFFSAADYSVLDEALAAIEDTTFQLVHYELDGTPIDYAGIWESVSNLQNVHFYRLTNPSSKIGLFLYAPNTETGDQSEWSWYLIFEK